MLIIGYMPVISSPYRDTPSWLFNGYLQTIGPNKLRKVPWLPYERERLILEDGDFVDLDWLAEENERLVILTHGLEGNSERPYIRSAAELFRQAGWDVLAWNCRSCSGELNRSPKFYFHGDTEDIRQVVNYATGRGRYRSIVLVGMSMGGSISLKYAGTEENPPREVKAVVAISTPCDLKASALSMDEFWNKVIFKQRFLQGLLYKIRLKAEQYPDWVELEKMERIERWIDFDEYFSAPINGYESADELYWHGSARHFLDKVRIPSLILNAQNDPLLTESCSPHAECAAHRSVWLEVPSQGGHVGFPRKGNFFTYAETRSLEFCREMEEGSGKKPIFVG